MPDTTARARTTLRLRRNTWASRRVVAAPMRVKTDLAQRRLTRRGDGGEADERGCAPQKPRPRAGSGSRSSGAPGAPFADRPAGTRLRCLLLEGAHERVGIVPQLLRAFEEGRRGSRRGIRPVETVTEALLHELRESPATGRLPGPPPQAVVADVQGDLAGHRAAVYLIRMHTRPQVPAGDGGAARFCANRLAPAGWRRILRPYTRPPSAARAPRCRRFSW